MVRRRLAVTWTLLLIGTYLPCAPMAQGGDAPNILWITAEDISATLGAYGDEYATTPNLDRLAAESVRYTQAYANSPVCSTARSTLITGNYATSLGTHQMRSVLPLPDFMTGFPSLLRTNGYYTSNNVKTDYNTGSEPAIIAASWDESSATAHWRNREKADQPFFSVFNLMTSHQSRTMVWPYEQFVEEVQSRLAPDQIHDPANAPIPPYYPDTPLVRREMARYYDCVTVMDKEVGEILAQLEADGLADNTIVFFFSDHGSGMPRHKRAALDTGLHVPLLIRFPEKYRRLAPGEPGQTIDRLVSFVDFGPAVLSLANIPVPDFMQGRPFLGEQDAGARQRLYHYRDRIDEARDLARGVRDDRYLYVRNYMPHLGYNQYTAWPDQGEIRHEFYRLADPRKMTEAQWHYAAPSRPLEELYAYREDPLNLNNLAASEGHREALAQMRQAHRAQLREYQDLGFIPESEMWKVFAGTTPWAGQVDLEELFEAAGRVGLASEADLLTGLKNGNPGVRFWSAIGLTARETISEAALKQLRQALKDPSMAARIELANTLARHGDFETSLPILIDALEHPSLDVTLHATRTIELLGNAAREAIPAMRRVLARAETVRPPETEGVIPGDKDLAWFIQMSAGAFLTRVGEAGAPATATSPERAAVDKPEMRVGVATADITPELPIRLTGYGNRDAEATEVRQRLYARALAIGGGDAPLSVLITADLLGVPEWLTVELAGRLQERVGLEAAHLAICATHTHTGPKVTGVAPALFGRPLPDDQRERVDRYSRWLLDRLEQLAADAINDLQPGTLAWGRGSVDFAVNRRRIEDGRWTGWGAFPEAPADHDFPVLAATHPDGKLRAVLVNYACHCTTLVGSHNFIHGDWAGEAAARLEKIYDGVTAMIAIGCGADANPYPRGELEHVSLHGQAIADEVGRVLAGGLIPIDQGPKAKMRRVMLPFAPITREELEQRANDPHFGHSARKLLEELGPNAPVPLELSYPIQTWHFGDTLAMVFLAGEVVADYAVRLKGELDGERLWVNAYANASPCYIASPRVIAEGGYEVDASMAYYHQPNRLEPVVEDIIVDAVRDMLPAAYERRWHDAEPARLIGDNQPRLIEPSEDGSLRLIAEAGTPFGPRIEYMPEPEWRAFGWWTDQDYVAWEVRVDQPGDYAVQMEWSVSDSSAGRPYLLEAGDGEIRLRGYVRRTGAWETFKVAEIGRLPLKAGHQRITLKPAGAYDSGGLMDLRELRLTPIRPVGRVNN